MLKALFALIMALPFVALPALGETPCPPSCLQPTLIGSLAVGGATEGLRLQGDETRTSLAAEARLRFGNVLGPLSLEAGALHFFDDRFYWRAKSRLTVGFDVPLGRDVALFGSHERFYRRRDAWSWAGVRIAFSSDGSGH